MTRIAVTGAAGFIGRHVLTELAGKPFEVIATCREEHCDLPSASNIKWIDLDLSRPPMNPFAHLGRPDLLIHLAWGGLPNYGSLHHFEIELPLQYAFIRQMAEAGLPSLLITGTCFEYGLQSGALAEDCVTKPSNPYGFAKDTLRKQIEYLQRSRSFNFTWARLFYMYGDGQAGNSLWSLLTAAIARGDKVFNMSGGEQLRDYLPVAEVARLVVQLALKRQNIGVINVCRGRPQSVRNLVERWVADNHWNIDLNLGFFPYPAHEPFAFWGDRAKLEAQIASS